MSTPRTVLLAPDKFQGTLTREQLDDAGISGAWDLTSRAGSTRRALQDGEQLLVEVGRDLGPWWVAAAEGTGPAEV